MSVFGKIMSAIFGHASAAPASTAPSSGAPSAPASKPSTSQPSTAPSAPPKPAAPVDVEAVLTELASQNKEKLDWRKSIVDLMKLLNLDSSLAARQELAAELHYNGNKNDSAAMNIWLHKQVMQKLAENGGKVPEELRK